MNSLRTALVLVLMVSVVAVFVPAQASAEIPTPASVLGFVPGSDRQLMDYSQLVDYLAKLDEASDRIELREVGSSPLGRTMYVAFISSAENLERLDELRTINRRLALDPVIPDDERAALIERGRVFVMATLSMHSGEVAPSQSLPLYAHAMATTDDPEQLRRLNEVVVMVVPSHNPDGMDMVVEHYREYLGTPYEGSSLPRVYHKYVGHDNNRDFVALTQEDTRVISRLYSTEWYPQVLVEKHQMGSTGPRYYVPPNHDPIAQVIDEGLWNWSAVFGANLARDMTADGLQGVASHWVFDDYWPGSTETSHWKNVISFLTEAASCKTATPIFVEPTELSVGGKGLAEYKKGVNMLDPWPGGRWALGDIVDYELSSMNSILATASRHRKEILRFRNELCRKEVEKGRSEAPYYFVLPTKQRDPSELHALVRLLQRHGVEVRRLRADTVAGEHHLRAGDFVVPLAQPYRPFVKEMLESQEYPERHYTPGGELIKPYDITSWSLPLHMGVRSVQVDTRSMELEERLEPVGDEDLGARFELPVEPAALVALPASSNQSYRIVFAALAEGIPVHRLTARMNLADGGTALPAGSFVLAAEGLNGIADIGAADPEVLADAPATDLVQLQMPRVALVETHFHDMDAGWTRYLFDTYAIPYTVLNPGDIEAANLSENYDVVVFPDASKDVLTKGKYKRGDRYVANDYPPEFRRPISQQGLADLTAFIQGGGAVVSWGGSTGLFTDGLAQPNDDNGEGDTIELPVRDISDERADVLVPGAFLAVDFVEDHPLTWGMPLRGGAFSRGRPILATSIPRLDTDRRVVAVYPERDLLLSGYLEGDKQLQNTPAAVWVRAGEGQLVLFAIRPQFRGSTPATFKLVFNALLLPKVE
jgi:hypothetical protein